MSHHDEDLVERFRADKDLLVIQLAGGPLEVAVDPGTEGSQPACRCYRCGRLLIADTVHEDAWNGSPVCSGCYR